MKWPSGSSRAGGGGGGANPTASSAPAPEPVPAPRPVPAPAEPRQRWRLTYRRSANAPQLSQRDDLTAWETAIAATGLPIVGLDGARARPKLMFGASLPVGMVAERELADVYLTRRCTVDVVREAIVAHLPAGCELLGLHDVWLGVAPLPAQVTAADYRIRLAPGSPDGWEVASAAKRLMAREAIQRVRPKGTGQVRYDLRPLLGGIQVVEPGPPVIMRVRTRFDPQLGAGRPDEVLAALADLIGRPCTADQTIRERLVLAGEDQE